MPIDILAGSSGAAPADRGQLPLDDIVESWQAGVAEFHEIREEFLLY